jgi:HAD superfamily hydrolase (TIGR01549 family)
MARCEIKISRRRSELFQERYLSQVKGFANVRTLFERILADGKKIALASSAQGDELEAYKERAQIADLIDAETSKDDAKRSKPHADIFEAALVRLGHPSPDATMVVGDTPYDIEAARKAGLQAIGVRCGGFSDSSLRGAIALYDNPTDLLAHYAESPLGYAEAVSAGHSFYE